MAAGDLITADYQIELRGVLMGVGSNYKLARPGIRGLGMPPVKTADVDLDHDDGSYGSSDFRGVRVITAPFLIEAAPATAMNRLKTLLTAWDVSTVDIPLYLRLPGWGKFHVGGRPRGLDEDLLHLASGVIAVFATFEALTPTIVTP